MCKINTTQKADELEGDTGDLEHDTDHGDHQGDHEKEEGMSKITVKMCQKGEKRKWDKKTLLYLLRTATE